jgi:hypothetical protein
MRLRVRIPPGTWMSVACECCVLSGRGLYDGLITRPEESYRLWCVVVCDLYEEALAHRGLLRKRTKFLMLKKSVLSAKCISLNSTSYGIPAITPAHPICLNGAHRDKVNISCTTLEVSDVASNDVRSFYVRIGTESGTVAPIVWNDRANYLKH